MKKYCENPFCKNRSVKEVSVSVNNPADQVRGLCAACEEAYTWGVQHGKMAGQQRTFWILAVADRGIVAYVQVYNSKAEAEKGMVEYLQEYQGYNGINDVNIAYIWLGRNDERLSVDIVPQDVDFGKLKNVEAGGKTADLARLNNFLHQCGFAVLTKNRQTPNPDASFEAWAYKGLLDFQSAEPVIFGLGRSCHDALDALDMKLAEYKGGDNDSDSEYPE